MLFWDSEAISVTGKLLGTTDSLLGSRQVMDDFLCIKHCPQTIQKMPAVLDDCLWVKHCPLRSFRLTLSKKKRKVFILAQNFLVTIPQSGESTVTCVYKRHTTFTVRNRWVKTCLLSSSFLYSLLTLPPNQGMVLLTFNLDLPTSIKAIKPIPHRHLHRFAWSRQLSVESLFPDVSRLY